MRKSSTSRPMPTRSGFTLIEVMVVLSLVVLLSSFVWPSFTTTLQRSELESAAQQVSNELSQVRLKAIESGVAQKFRYQPGKGVYEITPCPAGLLELHQELNSDSDFMSDASSDYESTDSTESPFGEELSDSFGDEPLLERDRDKPVAIAELPVGVAFSGVSRQVHADEFEMASEADEVWADDDGWSRPVIFFPNGQSTGGQIYLEQSQGFSVDVQLRSLTGEATVGKIHRLTPEEREAGMATDEEDTLGSDTAVDTTELAE